MTRRKYRFNESNQMGVQTNKIPDRNTKSTIDISLDLQGSTFSPTLALITLNYTVKINI